jgi:hypothetical protein
MAMVQTTVNDQRTGFAMVALEQPVQSGRQFRRGKPQHGRAGQNVHNTAIMRSNGVRLHGEIGFLKPAIGRVPGRYSGVIAEQSRWLIRLKDLPRRTSSTTKVHEDQVMPAHREMTSRIESPIRISSDTPPGTLVEISVNLRDAPSSPC